MKTKENRNRKTRPEDLIRKSSTAGFTKLSNARYLARRSEKPQVIVAGRIEKDGEHGEFWVLLPEDARRMEKAGYKVLDKRAK